MTFIESFLWGSGFSLGFCVGLVAWVFLRTWANRVCGVADEHGTILECHRKSVEALEERNLMTVETNELIERIADGIDEAMQETATD